MNPTITHRGGLAPDKYLKPYELDQVRDYMIARAQKRKNRRAQTDYLIIDILASAGLRASEVCDLTIQDTPTHHGKEVLYIRDGKGNVSRTVMISKKLAYHIDQYIKSYRPEAGISAPVVITCAGHKITYNTVWRKTNKIGRELGLASPLHPHKFRHSFAIKLYEVEKDLAFVSRQLGHANINTTMIYAHTTPETARRQMERM